jgi:hypothetical protein
MRALRTLLEIRFRFLDRRMKRPVVCRSLNRALDFIGGVAGLSEEASEKAAGGARSALPAIPAAEDWNSVMNPLPQRSQRNSN